MPRELPQTAKCMFKEMDICRHLPGYRLEGRLAPFFEHFLLAVLSEHLKD